MFIHMYHITPANCRRDFSAGGETLGAAQSLGSKYYQVAMIIMMTMTIVMMRMTKMVMVMIRHWVQRRIVKYYQEEDGWLKMAMIIMMTMMTMTIVMMRMMKLVMIIMRH